MGLLKKTLGGLEVLGISFTMFNGAEVKNLLRALAISEGVEYLIPLTKISEIGSRFLPPESIAVLRMFQVFLRLPWLSLSCFSK